MQPMNPELEEFKAWFGPNFTRVRQEHGFTTALLAKELQIPLKHLLEIEAGRVIPKMSTLLVVARVLKVRLRKFFP